MTVATDAGRPAHGIMLRRIPTEEGRMARASTATAAATIVDALAEDIILGRLARGTRLVEDELMERFDAKRHVVRAALDRLVQHGQAARTPNVGVAVRSFTDREVEELYDVRIMLESSAARRIAVPVDEARLAAVLAAAADHRSAVDRRDLAAIVEANDRFHVEVFRLAGNRVLSAAIRLHAQMASPIRFLTVSSTAHMQRSVEEHAGIVAALRGDDATLVADLCAQHLAPTRDHYLSASH